MLVQVNAGASSLEGEDRLIAALQSSTRLNAVTVMTHGYRFSPQVGDIRNPHRHILTDGPVPNCWKAVSWPRHLRIGRSETLGVALGWPALGSLGQAYRRAEQAGAALARIARIVAAQRPDLPVNVMAHSLGARVALSALPLLPEGALSRLILLSGAEYRGAATRALASPAGRGVRVVNVATQENLPFDLAFRALIRPRHWTDWPLAAGLAEDRPNWLDLRIDCPRQIDRLNEIGFRLRPPVGRYCHWSGYMRPGVFGLYRALLSERGDAVFARMRAALAEDRQRTGQTEIQGPGGVATRV